MNKSVSISIIVACAIGAALAQQLAVRQAHADQPSSVRSPQSPQFVGAVDSCAWETATASNANGDVDAVCPSGKYPVMGGCLSSNSSALLLNDHPYEGSSVTNHPDDTDGVFSLAATNRGWYCRYDTASVNHTVFALCC